MIWVSFDFNRPAFATGDDNSLGIAVKSRHRREAQWFSRNDFLRLLHIRNDFLDRLLSARTKPSKRHRSARQSKEFAPAEFVWPFAGAGREFIGAMRLISRMSLLGHVRRYRVSPHLWQVLQFVSRPLVSM